MGKLPEIVWLPLAVYAGLFVAINCIALLSFPFMVGEPWGVAAAIGLLVGGTVAYGQWQETGAALALLVVFPILFGLVGFGWALAGFSIPAAAAVHLVAHQASRSGR